MSLRDKLRQLRRHQLDKGRARAARPESPDSARGSWEEDLRSACREEILRIMQLVKGEYLGGEGTLYEFGSTEPESSFTALLLWESDCDSRTLSLFLRDDQVVEVRAGQTLRRGPRKTIRVRLKRKNWKKRLEDVVCSVLATPGACSSETPPIP